MSLGASSFCKFSFILCSFPSYIIIIILIVANFPVCCVCVVKKRPKLKSKYRDRVEIAIEYIKTINDFDDLVDPRTLARHCFGLEPSAYILCAIEIKKKSKCPFALLLFYFYFYFY